jgi:uncharacterized protein YjbJ (UPF0337 family)
VIIGRVLAPAGHGYNSCMSNFDEYKGRAKEAVGDLTDDEDLQREGKVDQAQGRVKEKVDDLGDKVKDVFNRD